MNLTVSATDRWEIKETAAKVPYQEGPVADGGLISANLELFPTVRVPIAEISAGVSLRRSGTSPQHVRLLAESDEPLPPILVQRSSMSVIDGAHRLLAVKMRGQKEIDVRLFDGDMASCFVMAVRANVAHGLPLSLADRKAAATNIIRLYPHWSDRMIASVSALAARTVAGLRPLSAENNQLEGRLGRDGRARPANPAERRRIAADIIAQHPEASLREIAQRAGISPETARKVRLQLRNGQSKPAGPQRGDTVELSPLRALWRDPALRSRQQGRLLLRMLSALDVLEDHGEQILRDIPLHDMTRVAEAARACSCAWERFADLAERQQLAAYGDETFARQRLAKEGPHLSGQPGSGEDGGDHARRHVMFDDGGQARGRGWLDQKAEGFGGQPHSSR